jgi:hypothetical protein
MPGKPAAHLGATVAHPLPPVLTGGPTAITVLVGGPPAWRAISPAAVAGLQSAKQIADTAIRIAENAAVLAAPTPGGPAARLAAEAAKGVAAVAMGSAITGAAAAGGDVHACMTPWPVPPHGPAVDIQGSPTVLCVGARIARQGDQLLEAIGPTNTITGGCMTVLVGAAGIVGNVPAGQAACVAARQGRTPPPGTVYPPGHPQAGQPIPANTAGQSYNNCGCETSRQLINQATNANVSQEQVLNQAMASGDANQVPGDRYNSGGTGPQGRQNILAANGVPSHREDRTMGNLESSAASGRGTIVVVDSQTLWTNGTTPPSTGDHVVVVTGVEYDDNGDVTNVIINDTGTGTCSQSVPIGVWNQATGPAIGNWQNNVTDNPIW